MPRLVLPLDSPLVSVSRVAPRAWTAPGATSRPASAVEMATLLLLGACSAATVMLIDFNLRLPGHAILRSVFPMALGIALVPRVGAGWVLGLGAWIGVPSLLAVGASEKGWGAITSLCLTGPLLDLALRRVRSGWRVPVAFALAGLASNLGAMAVQVTLKLTGMSGGGGRRFGEWLTTAAMTYPSFGLLAGLVSAAVWFHWRTPQPPSDSPEVRS